MDGNGFSQFNATGVASLQNLISRRTSSKSLDGVLQRDIRKKALYRAAEEDYCDQEPFSDWNCGGGGDTQECLGEDQDFQCANIIPDQNCFVGNIKELRRYRMEKRLDEYDQQLITRAKDAILKRNHAFKKIWEVKDLGESIDAQLGPNGGCINWMNWPPPVPRVSAGLNIPVEFYPDVEYDTRNPCSVKKLDMGFAARPQNNLEPSTAHQLKGLLNTHQSTSFKVMPTSLIFPRAKLGQRYTGILKLQNQGSVPRRIGVIAPTCRFFDIIWGAELNEETVIPPGLTVKIVVNFKPVTDVAVNDVLTILIHNDGAFLVPLLTSSESPPILELDEFDCGCSTLKRARTSFFTIRNLSGRGRFWLLSEEDFANEKSPNQPITSTSPRDQQTASTNDSAGAEHEAEVTVENKEKTTVSLLEPRNLLTSPPQMMLDVIAEEEEGEAEEDEQDEQEQEAKIEMVAAQPVKLPSPGRRKSSPKKEPLKTKSRKAKPDCVYIKPFKLYPACFFLDQNEKIEIKAKFKPMEANFYYEKVVMVCDNGEVRWIALKGIGVDQAQQELVSVEGEWTGPPCDLPADLNTKLSMDCGDLLHGERTQRKFVLVNNSCIPLFFFWSIRKLRASSPLHYSGKGLQHYLEGCVSADTTADEEDDYSVASQGSSRCIAIEPSQGVLTCNERLECSITATAPEVLGYHGCTVSLFVQQVDEVMLKLLNSRITSLNSRNLNSMPIYHENIFPESTSEEIGLFGRTQPRDDPYDIATKKLTEGAEHSVSEYVVLVPTPVCLAEEAIDNDASVEFYLATLKLCPKPEETLRLAGSGSTDSNMDDVEQFSFEDITLLDDESRRRSTLNGEPDTLDVNEAAKFTRNAQNINALHLIPMKQVEVWLRTVPMQCYFDPPFIIASGTASSTLERRFVFYNQTMHQIKVSFTGTVSDVSSIVFAPHEFDVAPQSSFEFRVVLHFQNRGKASGELDGLLTFPFTSVSCAMPFEINCVGPCVEALTPLINFGLVCFGQEKVKTLAIKNTGFQKCTWKATISKTAMEDEEGHPISLNEASMEHSKMIRFWPDSGTLEPEQFSGIQIYLTPSIHGKITTAIEIQCEGNPDNVLCIPVWAEVQSPSLFLRNPNLILHDIFMGVPHRCTSIVLVNPTTFLVNFSWGPPIGSQKELCRVNLKPNTGTVLPRRWIRIELTIAVYREITLSNLFLPCCVDGMKEPLVLQIEGTVSGPQVKIILPDTFPSPLNTCIEEAGEAGEGELRTGGYTAEDEMTGEDGLVVSARKALDSENKQISGKQEEEEGEGGGKEKKKEEKQKKKDADSKGEKKGIKTKKKWMTASKSVIDSIRSLKAKKKKRKGSIAASGSTKVSTKDAKISAKSKAKPSKGVKPEPLEENNPESAGLNATDDASLNETKKKKTKKDRDSGDILPSKKQKKKLSLTDSVRSAKRKDKQKKLKSQKPAKTSDSRLADDEEEWEEDEEEDFNKEGQRRPSNRNEYLGEHGCEDSEYPCLAPTVPTPQYPPTPLNSADDLNKIYFQEIDGKRVNRRIFVLKNTSPMKAAFDFKVINFPLNSWIDETKSPIENLIMRKLMSHSPKDIEARMFRDNNIAFEVKPRRGFMDPYATLEVSIVLHTLSTLGTGKSIIYRDEIHCDVEGLPETFVIKLEAVVNSS